ncbi:hypothetical protein chiPu_0022584 [Chiloscyllium punctatum]|uniref:Uncharacterized protein n=1 Tax=Chiloscyllium punctatum TaxID=137246 RepID=A0A401REE7_CHIPU|nr:hypothetical protein [Chiloscyllium punctatum]
MLLPSGAVRSLDEQPESRLMGHRLFWLLFDKASVILQSEREMGQSPAPIGPYLLHPHLIDQFLLQHVHLFIFFFIGRDRCRSLPSVDDWLTLRSRSGRDTHRRFADPAPHPETASDVAAADWAKPALLTDVLKSP